MSGKQKCGRVESDPGRDGVKPNGGKEVNVFTGGPVSSGSTAYGTGVMHTELSSGERRPIFMAVDYIENWGLRVITWP